MNKCPRLFSSVCGSRRQFLSGLASCACCAAAGPLVGFQPRAASAAEPTRKPKIRVVFCETANDKPIWPNIGYDFAARRQKLLRVLTQGCANLELLPTTMLDKPTDAEEVLKGNSEVQGY